MRIMTRIFVIVLVSAFLYTGCDNTLNVDPLDELGSEAVWQDPVLAEAYLNEIYSGTGHGFGDPMMTPGVVDEAVNTHGHDGSVVVTSNLTPDDSTGWISQNGESVMVTPSTRTFRQPYNWINGGRRKAFSA